MMSEENQSECITVRIGHSLNEAEKNHVTSRRESALECLKRHEIHCSLEEMPNIALVASGGSERAMLGLLGSLLALFQDDLLDCVLYLAGLSGSTWCMVSLYKEPNWSSKLEKVKEDIKNKLGGNISFKEKFKKLKKYYREKDNFSLTDFWAVLYITMIVKEIDEQTFSDLRSKQSTKDPYPIYTVIDKQSHEDKLDADTFVEITPHETGYSITGAFVDTSSFGSQFDQGAQIKDQPEMDMLFLQGLCGSGLASIEKILEELLTLIKDLILGELDMMGDYASSDIKQTDIRSLSAPHADEAGQVLLNLVEVNRLVLREEDPSSHITVLKDLLRGNLQQDKHENLFTMSKKMNKKTVKEYTLYICDLQTSWNLTCNRIWENIAKCIELVVCWVWGTTYNFLHNMTAAEVSPSVCRETIRQYVDAGIAINSPFLPLLRRERHIDLIVSLDFSENDPFESLTETAKTCKRLHIDFPEVPKMSKEEKSAPKDFYVFEGHNAPAVIHIPLFNIVNCDDKAEIKRLKHKYTTFQGPYSSDLIEELLEKAGLNIKNNKRSLLTEIKKIIQRKQSHICSFC
ncbi:cytosolic phospholipase A2 gamma isoform X1 [Sinocyclocheilus anshuiensis]|uniref:cytosolic phospholipase A2 gamma isoform X1 n=1 Tax=Sinocyclocheilus anshuiensis TaxID=1608454 RepID=UPI0007BAC2D5|nr:PREDICTED: cytosolic phospholipase A2 gamma-like isoform X1 [Sinocyclocheilus anshuiensis]